MKMTIEMRAAEGGDDAKALMANQAAIYETYAKRHGLKAYVAAQGLG